MRVMLAVFVLCFGFALAATAAATERPPRLLDRSSSSLLPMLWATEPEPSFAKIHTADIQRDPLLFGINVLSALRSESIRDDAERLSAVAKEFSAMHKRRNQSGYWHHEAYHPFPEGWYSAMDFASMALAAMALSEATEDPGFMATGKNYIDQMIKPVDAGGTIHDTGPFQCWLAEFVWPGIKDEEQTNVLNGFFYALQALLIYAQSFPDREEYRVSYECALDSYKQNADLFFYEKDPWLYYMLSPLTPNQAHYLIYETNQLDALYEIDPDPFYRQQSDQRRAIFQDHFPVFISGDKFYFSKVGVPHPFRIDIYGIRFEFFDASGNLLEEFAPNPQGNIMTGELPSGAVSVGVTSFSGSSAIRMYAGRLVPLPEFEYKKLAYQAQPIFDLVEENGLLRLYPAASEQNHGRLILTLDEPVAKAELESFLIDVEFSEPTFWSIGFYDKNEQEIFRYLPPAAGPGRTLLPLSLKGFDKYDSTHEEIHKAMIYFYTHNLNSAVELKLNQLVSFRNFVHLQTFADSIKSGSLHVNR